MNELRWIFGKRRNVFLLVAGQGIAYGVFGAIASIVARITYSPLDDGVFYEPMMVFLMISGFNAYYLLRKQLQSGRAQEATLLPIPTGVLIRMFYARAVWPILVAIAVGLPLFGIYHYGSGVMNAQSFQMWTYIPYGLAIGELDYFIFFKRLFAALVYVVPAAMAMPLVYWCACCITGNRISVGKLLLLVATITIFHTINTSLLKFLGMYGLWPGTHSLQEIVLSCIMRFLPYVLAVRYSYKTLSAHFPALLAGK